MFDPDGRLVRARTDDAGEVEYDHRDHRDDDEYRQSVRAGVAVSLRTLVVFHLEAAQSMSRRSVTITPTAPAVTA